MSEEVRTCGLPILPLRNVAFFPYNLMPFSVGRPESVAAVEAALASEEKTLAVFAQRDANIDNPQADDLYQVGTKAIIKQMGREGDAIGIILQGLERVELVEIEQTTPYLCGRCRSAPVEGEIDTEGEALQQEVLAVAEKYFELAQTEPVQVNLRQLTAQISDPMHLVYLIGMMLALELEKAQQLLAATTPLDALRLLHEDLLHEVQVMELRKQIASQARTEIGREQREYYLRQQLDQIQKELGEGNPEDAELEELAKRIEEAGLPQDVQKEVQRELARLKRMHPSSSDYQVTRTYLDLVTDLPWNKHTNDNLNLQHARKVLDEDHYGLKDIKERIIEHLAVLRLNPQAKAPILCFVGPPGVGKTSLGQSIARALNRKFERFSLGGLSDEAELRGHRRTYIGAMPGRMVQAIRRAGVMNPLIMLDEVDKLGRDFRGDPAAALMEILDPAQNTSFRDNYLDLPLDLSKVFFVVTANSTEPMPRPLLDRMEILRLSGYTDEEKLEIAHRYLLPRQRHEAGLADSQLILPDDTLKRVIRGYTREAGVRELERMLGRLARKCAVRIADALPTEGPQPDAASQSLKIGPNDLTELLGPERFFAEQARKSLTPGVATGLAWTEAGGDVLYVEVVRYGRADALKLTGQLGNVMKESAEAAVSYVMSICDSLGVPTLDYGVHIHVPAGAIPKDGPSAGVTIVSAVASLFTGNPVRSDTAMTGEITLSGLVLPVGGIKEKVLAARRAGLRRVILPAQNRKDLHDLPDNVREEMEFLFAERIEQVLAGAIPPLAERLHIDRTNAAAATEEIHENTGAA